MNNSVGIVEYIVVISVVFGVNVIVGNRVLLLFEIVFVVIVLNGIMFWI